MLLSPGNSPRHLSSPSPSLPIDAAPSAAPSGDAGGVLKRPRAATSVLDEDTYVAAIERIVERDFFPDLPRLRDSLDLLEAARSRDPIALRDAQLKIRDRRRAAAAAGTGGTSCPRSVSSLPAFSVTPFGGQPTPAATDAPSAAAESNLAGDNVDAGLSLDEFFRRYTSEDNESFSRIIEKVNKRRREKYAHLLEGEKEAPAPLIEGARRDCITDGYGTSGQPLSTLESWNYTPKNLLMYYPADRGEAPLTDEEREVRLKAMTKEINRSNTRFHGKVETDTRPAEEAAILYAPIAGSTPNAAAFRDADKSKKYDLEDLRKTPNPFFVESSKKAESGYSFMLTPSPAPGVDESPFITWGEIEGTPLRLDTEESLIGLGGSGDACFNIPLPPVRDVKAHELSREAAKKIKERSKLFKKPPLPSPARGGSVSPKLLSPAAQKFMRRAIANAKSSRTFDESLRASYRGSSPVVGTPKSRFSRDTSAASRSPSVA